MSKLSPFPTKQLQIWFNISEFSVGRRHCSPTTVPYSAYGKPRSSTLFRFYVNWCQTGINQVICKWIVSLLILLASIPVYRIWASSSFQSFLAGSCFYVQGRLGCCPSSCCLYSKANGIMGLMTKKWSNSSSIRNTAPRSTELYFLGADVQRKYMRMNLSEAWSDKSEEIWDCCRCDECTSEDVVNLVTHLFSPFRLQFSLKHWIHLCNVSIANKDFIAWLPMIHY